MRVSKNTLVHMCRSAKSGLILLLSLGLVAVRPYHGHFCTRRCDTTSLGPKPRNGPLWGNDDKHQLPQFSQSNLLPHASRGAAPETRLARNIRLRLRGGFDEDDDSDTDAAEGPDFRDDDDDDDEDLLDLSGAQSNDDEGGEQNEKEVGTGEKRFDDGAGDDGAGDFDDLLNKFMESEDDDDDSQDISNEWVRTIPETAKDDPEFMEELGRLEQALIENNKLPRPSFAERVQYKFVRAAQDGKEEVVKSLFRDYSARVSGLVNARCEIVNITALMHAAANGHFGTVRALLKRGADVRALGSQQETAMHLAASEGMSEICVMLYEADPELIHLRDRWNTTPIMRSIDQGWAHTSKTLYNLGSALESFGLECSERRLCNGMRWPITRLAYENDSSVICPLCMFGYILPDTPLGDGHISDLSALLPPEFYPHPFLTAPKDGSGPPRPGPCWEPVINGTKMAYNGTGEPQQWPNFGSHPAPIVPRSVRLKRERVNY